jgi:hypothetical protein
MGAAVDMEAKDTVIVEAAIMAGMVDIAAKIIAGIVVMADIAAKDIIIIAGMVIAITAMAITITGMIMDGKLLPLAWEQPLLEAQS